MSALQYLRQQFGGNFTVDYMALSKEDRAELQKYAHEEMAVLGLAEEPNPEKA